MDSCKTMNKYRGHTKVETKKNNLQNKIQKENDCLPLDGEASSRLAFLLKTSLN